MQRLDESRTIETSTEMRDLAEVLCRALLMICRYLNKRYRLGVRALE